MDEGHRECSSCGELKSHPDSFYHPNAKYGWGLYCKQCWNKNLYALKRARKTTLKSQLTRRLNDARKRARNRAQSGREDGVCTLKLSDLMYQWRKQEGKCALTGRTMVYDSLSTGPEGVSLDRINSNKGYVPGNIQLVCVAVNNMKRRLSNEDLVGWCYDILATASPTSADTTSTDDGI